MEATVDVGAWPRKLGLGQYETSFRKNEIDGEVLADLNDTRSQIKRYKEKLVEHWGFAEQIPPPYMRRNDNGVL
jgi:hypothetical protein